jgi:hypothetical protein
MAIELWRGFGWLLQVWVIFILNCGLAVVCLACSVFHPKDSPHMLKEEAQGVSMNILRALLQHWGFFLIGRGCLKATNPLMSSLLLDC